MIKIEEIMESDEFYRQISVEQTLVKNILVRVHPKEDVITLVDGRVIFPPDEVRWLKEVKRDLFNILGDK
jgi:hypothetical protein